MAAKKRKAPKRAPAKPRAHRGEIIDAEIVEEERAARSDPPPVVVEVKQSLRKPEREGIAHVEAVSLQAVMHDVSEAVEVGKTLGALLTSVFRRR